MRHVILCVALSVLVACTQDPERIQPAPASGNSPITVASQPSCLEPEPELRDAVVAVVGDITVARPGVEGDADQMEVIVCKTSDRKATATVTVLGQRDDSVSDTRHELVLDKGVNGGWVATSHVRLYRCQPGRGHRAFSSELCV